MNSSDSHTRRPAGPLTWAVWVVFGLLFAFIVWQGVSSALFPGAMLVAVRNANAWVFLGIALGGVIVPLALGALAIWLGRSASVGRRALLLLAALSAAPAVVTTLWWLGTLLPTS